MDRTNSQWLRRFPCHGDMSMHQRDVGGEQRKLVLVPREMPLSAIQLEHMMKLARLGVVIMPASPGFYHHPHSISDLVDFVVARIMDHLDIVHDLVPRWGQ